MQTLHQDHALFQCSDTLTKVFVLHDRNHPERREAVQCAFTQISDTVQDVRGQARLLNMAQDLA